MAYHQCLFEVVSGLRYKASNCYAPATLTLISFLSSDFMLSYKPGAREVAAIMSGEIEVGYLATMEGVPVQCRIGFKFYI